MSSVTIVVFIFLLLLKANEITQGQKSTKTFIVIPHYGDNKDTKIRHARARIPAIIDIIQIEKTTFLIFFGTGPHSHLGLISSIFYYNLALFN